MTNKELNTKLEKMRRGFKNLPHQTQAERINQLACKVILEAVADYTHESTLSERQGLPKYFFDKSVILRDLETQKLMAHSNGANFMAINALKDNAYQVKENIRKMAYNAEEVI